MGKTENNTRKSAPGTSRESFGGGDAERPITAGLARRLAAAADGYRNGNEIWFTARYVPIDGDYQVSKAIESIMRPAAPEDPEFGLFGPFQNDSEAIKRTPVTGVTLHLEGGEEMSFRADEYDAVIWSTSAIRKFALPHYAEYAGLDFALKVQNSFLQQNVVAFVHAPNTEYELVRTTDGEEQYLIVA